MYWLCTWHLWEDLRCINFETLFPLGSVIYSDSFPAAVLAAADTILIIITMDRSSWSSQIYLIWSSLQAFLTWDFIQGQKPIVANPFGGSVESHSVGFLLFYFYIAWQMDCTCQTNTIMNLNIEKNSVSPKYLTRITESYKIFRLEIPLNITKRWYFMFGGSNYSKKISNVQALWTIWVMLVIFTGLLQHWHKGNPILVKYWNGFLDENLL